MANCREIAGGKRRSNDWADFSSMFFYLLQIHNEYFFFELMQVENFKNGFSSKGCNDGTISCFSYDKGGRWCYVRDNIGTGYSTCPDLRRSKKFHGRSWSYHACATPTLHSYDCRHCQGNSGHGQGGYGRSNVGSSKIDH